MTCEAQITQALAPPPPPPEKFYEFYILKIHPQVEENVDILNFNTYCFDLLYIYLYTCKTKLGKTHAITLIVSPCVGGSKKPHALYGSKIPPCPRTVL